MSNGGFGGIHGSCCRRSRRDASHARIREAGDSALLLELDDGHRPGGQRARDRDRRARFARAALPGVRDVVSTYRIGGGLLRSAVADVDGRARRCSTRSAMRAGARAEGGRVDVPVVVRRRRGPGPARRRRVRRASAATRSSSGMPARDYRVFMLGFLPGFAYMGTSTRRLRRPATRDAARAVPAGSVGIAGRQTGDLSARVSGRLADHRPHAGARCSIAHAIAAVAASRRAIACGSCRRHESALSGSAGPTVRPEADGAIRRSRTLRSDAIHHRPSPRPLHHGSGPGRWGHQASGVPVSGADGPRRRIASRTRSSATSRRRDARGHAGRSGAADRARDASSRSPAQISARRSTARRCRCIAPVRLPAGSVLRFGERRSGARAYVAFDGGIDVPPVLGSRATHVAERLGGVTAARLRRAIACRSGDRRSAVRGAASRSPRRASTGGARLRVLPGPQDDYFPTDCARRAAAHALHGPPQSDRMGYRLTGGRDSARRPVAR